MVSLFRDTYLNLSKEGSYNKFNQAYFTGGPEQAMAAINRNLDLNVTDYATFNWKAVADAITILGGVDVELSKAEFYYINAFISETVAVTGIGSTQLTHAGMNHLDGVQAVAYGRLPARCYRYPALREPGNLALLPPVRYCCLPL